MPPDDTGADTATLAEIERVKRRLVGQKMNYDEITKITAERISDYMTEAVNTDSEAEYTIIQ